MATLAPKFPHVEVQLSGSDGNAFAILGNVTRAMKRGGCSQAEVDEFMTEATSGDYDHVLQTAMKTVEVN